MKKTILILGLLIIMGMMWNLAWSQTTIIDFETENSGYTASDTEGSGYTDVFNRTNPNKGGNSTYMWSVEDISLSNPSIVLDQIDITGTSFTFAIDMITHHFNDWDNNDELLITYSIDSGNSQNMMWIQNTGEQYNDPAALDTDFDGDGECAYVLPALTTGTGTCGCVVSSDIFETFTTAEIPISGSTLDITLQFNGLTSTDEGIYLDNIVITQAVTGGNALPSITNITTVPTSPTSTDDVFVSADVTDSDGTITDVTLSWSIDETNYTDINMSVTTRANYTSDTAIPAQVAGTTVYYKISATDDEPETSTSSIQTYSIPGEYTIYQIQGQQDASPYVGESVITSGIVTAVYSGYIVIQDGNGAWNGIWIVSSEAVAEGDNLTVSGVVTESNSYGDTDNTIIADAVVTINSSNNALPRTTSLSTAEIAEEQYEGVFVRTGPATCTSEADQYNEWEIDDNSGACRINDLGYVFSPTLGTPYTVMGIVGFSYSNFKIEPRDADDVVSMADVTAPEILTVSALSSISLEVVFNEEVDQTTAEISTNYVIQGLTVTSATLDTQDATKVVLIVSEMSAGAYTLVINNVEDLSSNAIVDGTMEFNYAELPVTGDVVINEIGEPYDMPNTYNSSYIELNNTTDSEIDISGWIVHSILASRGTSSFTFPTGTTISAYGYIIATRSRTNFLSDYGTYVDENIVPVAQATTGNGVYIGNNYSFSLEMSNGTVLESTSYTKSWNSTVLERADATVAANDDANWYLTYQADPVQGTPGQANSTAPSANPYTINQLQAENHENEMVITTGIVTAIFDNLFTIQDGTGAFNGIWISSTEAVTLGDNVTIEGMCIESSSLTQINLDSITINSSGNALPSASVLSTLAVSVEDYEGVLVQTTGECDNNDLGYGEWSIDDGSGTVRIDDLGYVLDPLQSVGNTYEVTGVVNYNHGTFKIEPRDADDIVETTSGPPQTIIGDGLHGQELLDYLFANYKTSSTLGYDSARDVMYGEIDLDENNILEGVYSGFTTEITSLDPQGEAQSEGFNCEHAWPQSLGADQEPQRSDLHHLYPTRIEVNSARGNAPFLEISDSDTDEWFRLDYSQSSIPTSLIDEYSEKENSIPYKFEPREEFKGNVARSMCYFMTMYPNDADEDFFNMQKQTFKEWNLQDAVDQREYDRTNDIAAYQNNKINPFVSDTTLVRRIWFYQTPEPAKNIVINEIHYNPSTTQGVDTDYEFLELYNNEAEEVNLSGYYFSAGIDYTFTEADIIPANGYFLLAVNSNSYANSVQWTSGGLLNSGETITLLNSENVQVDEVTYSDVGDWPSAPDGGGSSLELISPELDNSLASNWQASFVDNGTPGAENSTEGLGIPQNVQISHDGTNVTISWDAVDGATSYKVYVCESPDGEFIIDETGSFPTTTSWIKAEASSRKFYQVRAVQ